MEQVLSETMALLSRTPSALDALLRDLPEIWTHQDEGDNTWSVVDVIGHLIYCERTDWMPRAKLVLQFGQSRPFEPFDRSGHLRESRGKSLPQLLDEFSHLRSDNLRELHELNLCPQDLELRGKHPSLGDVTLAQLLSAWAVHDLTHLHQVSRIMAHQYREAVGPWSEYLGVLKCAGHSSP